MLNFNNKKEIRQPSNPSVPHQIQPNPDRPQHDHQQNEENTPTECLLLISQIQERGGYVRKYGQEKEGEEVEVTPWGNVPYRMSKDKIRSKSKTSTLMSSCIDETCVYPVNSGQKLTDRRQKDSRLYKVKKQSHKLLKMVDKSSQSIKNIRSVIERYTDHPDTMTVTSQQMSAKKIKIDTNPMPTKPNQYRKIYESCLKHKYNNLTSKNKTRPKRQNNQNHLLEVADFSMGRFEEKLKILEPGEGKKKKKEYKNWVTDSILRQNTGIVNQATKLNTFDNQPDEVQSYCIRNVRDFGEMATSMENNSMMKREPSHEQPIFRKAEFQNILSDAQKKTSEYYRIKNKIIQSIKQESIVRESQQFDINKSKKMLGRYFKQIQEKNPKTKNKMNLSLIANPNFNFQMNLSCNVQKNQICDLGMGMGMGLGMAIESHSLARHLSEKHKLFISKAK